jgi:membrane protease YdiL (CAAX protease family)
VQILPKVWVDDWIIFVSSHQAAQRVTDDLERMMELFNLRLSPGKCGFLLSRAALDSLRGEARADGPTLRVAGAMLVGAGLFVLGAAVLLAVRGTHVSAEAKSLAEKLIGMMRDRPIWLSWSLIALLPAIGEELLFRGWVQSALVGAWPSRGRVVAGVLAQAAAWAAVAHIPGPTPLPGLGSVLALTASPWLTFHAWAQAHGRVFTIWLFHRPFVVLADAEAVKYVFQDARKNFPKDDWSYDFFRDVLGYGLVARPDADRDAWQARARRRGWQSRRGGSRSLRR